MAALRTGPFSFLNEEEKEKRDDERQLSLRTLRYSGDHNTRGIEKNLYTKVLVDSDVTEIEDNAFSEWVSLEEVEFSKDSQVNRIGRNSFTYCTALSSIKLPASVQLIEKSAFMFSALENVDFEESSCLDSIRESAFDSCHKLESIKIPGSVRTIGEGAFRNSRLEIVEFGSISKLERIKDEAFAGCQSLQTIEIPSSVKSIGHRAFRDCGLDQVIFHKSAHLECIGNTAFEHCENLTEIWLPSSVLSLQKDCFRSCTGLKRINFPKKLKYVGHRCFSHCSNLEQITMNLQSETSFGRAVFEECTLLKKIVSVNDKQDDLFSTGVVAESMHELEGDEQQDLLKKILDGSGRFDDFVATMFESHQFKLRGLSRKHLDLITKRVFQSRRMQNCLSRLSVERAPVFVMMLDGYMNVMLVCTFIYASDRFLLASGSLGANVAILCFSGYFLLRELQQLHSYGFLLYIDNSWNGIDCLRVALAAASAISMQTTSGGEEVLEEVRYLLLCTGIVLIGGFILFLRATVLPFAEFVGGLTAIFRKLLPFLIVSSLLLFAFSYVYFTTEFDRDSDADLESDVDEDSDECPAKNTADFSTLSASMLTSLSFFFSGPDPTRTWQDVLFGIIIVVVLLNVVIAIVNDAWAASRQKGRALFWAYRIGFLEEVESLMARMKNSCCSLHVPRLVKLTRWVDKVGNRSLRDRVNWEAEPYNTAKEDFGVYACFCSHRHFALDNYDMPLADMEKLLEMGSVERDWYWANHKQEKKYYIEVEGVFVGEALLPKRREVIENSVWYVLFIILGVPTCGLLWPRRVRRLMFGVGTAADEEEELPGPPHVTPADIKAMESRLQMRLESRVGALETRVATLESNCQAQYEKLESKIDELIILLREGR